MPLIHRVEPSLADNHRDGVFDHVCDRTRGSYGCLSDGSISVFVILKRMPCELQFLPMKEGGQWGMGCGKSLALNLRSQAFSFEIMKPYWFATLEVHFISLAPKGQPQTSPGQRPG